MAKEITFEDEDRDDVTKEPISPEDAAGKIINISQPVITTAKLSNLKAKLRALDIEKTENQKRIDNLTAEITEIETALNVK